MATIREMLRQARADGYLDENAEAKVSRHNWLGRDVSEVIASLQSFLEAF